MDKLNEIALKHNIEYINIIPIEFEEYSSVIVGLLPYYCGEQESLFSKYTRGYDYHQVGKEIMTSILEELKINDCKILIDVSPLDEKKLAISAGLGIMGKNGLVINEKYGSFVFIMTALTKLKTKTTLKNKTDCINCGECAKICPNHAISDKVNYNKCVSQITQKKVLTDEEVEIIKNANSIWGCDKCQDACPMNKKTITPINEFKKELLIDIPALDALSNKNFKEKYSKYSMSYKGKRIIQRNKEIINSNKGEI